MERGRHRQGWSCIALLGIALLQGQGLMALNTAAPMTAVGEEIAAGGFVDHPWHHYPYRYTYAYPGGHPLNYNNYFSYPYNSYYYRYSVYRNTPYWSY